MLKLLVCARIWRSIVTGLLSHIKFLPNWIFRYDEIQRRRESDREHINHYTNLIADAQNELDMLRARWKQLTDEEKRLITDNARYWEELQKARADLDEETLGRIDFQNQVNF